MAATRKRQTETQVGGEGQGAERGENKQGWGIRQSERPNSQGITVVPLPHHLKARRNSVSLANRK
jgi:hypothetical protein